jgi:hypothetical protein
VFTTGHANVAGETRSQPKGHEIAGLTGNRVGPEIASKSTALELPGEHCL